MKPSSMPNASSRTLAIGARQLVVQEALETIRCSGLQFFVVDADDDRGVDLVLGRHGQHARFFGARLEVLLERLSRAEHAGRLDHDVDTELLPGDLRGVALVESSPRDLSSPSTTYIASPSTSNLLVGRRPSPCRTSAGRPADRCRTGR